VVKVLVCGSRDWTDRGEVDAAISGLPGEHEAVTVVVGDANGADAIAAEFAAYYGFEIHLHRANWDYYGKRAGILRNLAMLDECPDLVIAFQRNGSRGTQHTIDEARKRDIPVKVHTA
jgi:hypothetical protein